MATNTPLTPFTELQFPPGTRAVFLDLDGTLLDSMGVWTEIDRRFLAKRGLEIPPDYLEAIVPLSFRDTALYTIRRFHLNETPDALMREWHGMALEAYRDWVPLKAEARGLVDWLRGKGYRLAAATASTPELALPCLARLGMLDRLEMVISTEELMTGKNEPAFWEMAAGKMGLPPHQCAHFDDAAAGLLAAKAAGLYTVAVFDRFGDRPEKLAAADAMTTLDPKDREALR